MKSILCLCCWFFSLPLWAVSDSTQTYPKQAKHFKDKDMIALPVVYFSPETSVAFGGLFMKFFKLAPDSITHTSNWRVAGIYTLNNQVVLDTRANLFFNQNKNWLDLRLNYFKFPENYYGIGNETPDSNEEEVSYQMVDFTVRALHKVFPHHTWYVGVQSNFQTMFDVQRLDGGLLETEEVTGYRGGISSGLGFITVWDHRDNLLNSQKGYYFEFSARFFKKYLGSDFDYHMYQWDARKFVGLDKNCKHVLGFHSIGTFISRDPPFRRMGLLGGGTIMRGIYQGRYRDKNLMAFQSEYRFQMLPRWGIALFASTGDVASKVRHFELNDFKFSYGGGIRFMVNRKERVNLRLDFGLSQGSTGFYFNLAEAF